MRRLEWEAAQIDEFFFLLKLITWKDQLLIDETERFKLVKVTNDGGDGITLLLPCHAMHHWQQIRT